MLGLLFGSRSLRPTMTGLNSPQARTAFFGILVALGAVVLFWLGAAAVLSLVNVWLFLAATAALGVLVYVRQRREDRRQWRVANDCCAACGYDLSHLPTRTCPECGRDNAADEPTWKRLQRAHAAKFGRLPSAVVDDGGVEVDEAQVRLLLAKAEQSTLEL